MKESTISIIIPAFNEENNLESAVKNVISATRDKFSDYEIFILDDCSQDKTGIIADKLAQSNSRIKVIHNKKNQGFAYNYKKGVELSNNDYVAMVPGDDEILAESVSKIFSSVGKADIVIPYTINRQIRPLSRQIVSCLFTALMNLLFGLKLKYYNGPVVYRKEVIKSISIKSKSFAFQSEALVKLIKKGHSFIEIGMYIGDKKYGKSKISFIYDIFGVLKTMVGLFKEVYF